MSRLQSCVQCGLKGAGCSTIGVGTGCCQHWAHLFFRYLHLRREGVGKVSALRLNELLISKSGRSKLRHKDVTNAFHPGSLLVCERSCAPYWHGATSEEEIMDMQTVAPIRAVVPISLSGSLEPQYSRPRDTEACACHIIFTRREMMSGSVGDDGRLIIFDSNTALEEFKSRMHDTLGVGQFKLQVLDRKLGSENEPSKVKFENLGQL
ncbi:hypothetical protein DFH08DRAFT_815294 [Mycena albidolilacea]|uniref:Uncharacterized protein n=1 Tax=Mycena albidolilacea TaxID=1033008 RepID=A0AAD6ZN13_9AGAR|nr:hypothetical protein DFH08DRAFT_815294 [Mycena albidolilacea]